MPSRAEGPVEDLGEEASSGSESGNAANAYFLLVVAARLAMYHACHYRMPGFSRAVACHTS